MMARTPEPQRRALREWLANLTGDQPETAQTWREVTEALAACHGPLAEALWRHTEGEERIRLLTLLFSLVAHSATRDFESSRRLYDEAEALGMHLLPIDIYSPLPVIRDLADHVWTDRWDGPGLDWALEAQLALMGRLGVWAAEMQDTPLEQPAEEHRYYYRNGVFDALDAIVYYSLIREYRPRTVLEVGAGFSTMVAAQAAVRNGATRVRAIEPYPAPVLERGFPGLSALIPQPLQQVPLDEFLALEPRDILFIDSTHVTKIDSDVNHLVFRIIPRLKPGVLVHFHDVYLPWHGHQELLTKHKRFWNEEYLIHAFLLFNRAFRVLWGSTYLGHHAADALAKAFPHFPAGLRPMGSSLWIERHPDDPPHTPRAPTGEGRNQSG